MAAPIPAAYLDPQAWKERKEAYPFRPLLDHIISQPQTPFWSYVSDSMPVKAAWELKTELHLSDDDPVSCESVLEFGRQQPCPCGGIV